MKNYKEGETVIVPEESFRDWKFYTKYFNWEPSKVIVIPARKGSKEEYLRYTHQSILMMTNNCDTKASFLLAILGIIVSVFVSLEPLHMFIRKIITDYSLAFSGIDWLITLNMICYLFSAIGIIIVFFS